MILFDENLSKRLPFQLADMFPGARHAVELGLKQSPDAEIWRAAAENGLVIVGKDADFVNLSVLHGAPPKVVWLALGNTSAKHARETLHARAAEIITFLGDGRALLTLTG